jgi:ribosomal protein L29
LQEQITSLKQQYASLKMQHEQKIDDLQAERSNYSQYFFSLRNQLALSMKHDEKQLSYLITSSNEAMKVNYIVNIQC